MSSEIETFDPSFNARLTAMEANGVAFNALAPLKDCKSRLSTNASGLWSKTYAAGYWINEPSINVNPITASGGAGQLTWRVTKTLTAGAWKVDVQFTLLPATVNVAVLGAVTLGVNPGTTLFDYMAAEPNG